MLALLEIGTKVNASMHLCERRSQTFAPYGLSLLDRHKECIFISNRYPHRHYAKERLDECHLGNWRESVAIVKTIDSTLAFSNEAKQLLHINL